jgi:beta-lactamase superfamily II metal-dependent hydrolase
MLRAAIVLALVVVVPGVLGAQSRTLDIYWIDVEGGAATLVVAPTGESMLIDTGWETDGRDAKRIVAAAQQAGIKKIDHLVVSHYHGDHVGGLPALSKMMPIERFYSRGDNVEPMNQKWYENVKTASGGKTIAVKAGDHIRFGGVDALVVTSNEKAIASPLKGGGPNPLCADAEHKASAGLENSGVVGLLLAYNRFTFLDMIDLDWHQEMELTCPVNKLGTVTVFQSDRHGSWDGAGAPAFLGAIKPQVVVFNNGPRKGLGQAQVDANAKPTTPAGTKVRPYERNGYARAAALPGVEGIWQGHLSLLDKDPKHNTSTDMIANLEETADCKGHWIKASVESNGRFTIVNGRNGFSRTYTAR